MLTEILNIHILGSGTPTELANKLEELALNLRTQGYNEELEKDGEIELEDHILFTTITTTEP